MTVVFIEFPHVATRSFSPSIATLGSGKEGSVYVFGNLMETTELSHAADLIDAVSPDMTTVKLWREAHMKANTVSFRRTGFANVP